MRVRTYCLSGSKLRCQLAYISSAVHIILRVHRDLLTILAQEAARIAVQALQSIFLGSEEVKGTPSAVRNAIQESKQSKPKVD